MTSQSDKTKARKVVQARINTLGSEHYHEKSEIVLKHVHEVLDELYKLGNLHHVLSYYAQNRWKEIDLSLLEDTFPDVKFDYVTPKSDALLPAGTYDAILVPLFGFNDHGYRLGHGAGWYDAFLYGQPNAIKIGVGLDIGKIEFNPEHHDVVLNMIITEGGVCRFL